MTRSRVLAAALSIAALTGCSQRGDLAAMPMIARPSVSSSVKHSKPDLGGHYKILHAFNGSADGAFPYAGVVLDGAGNIYGTTSGGGASNDGTVFKLDSSGNETVIHSFTGPAGHIPIGNLILDNAGNLYGTTAFGGPHDDGVVFKIDPAGNETEFHRFDGADGRGPMSELTRDASGDLFGTTASGGAFNCGVAFRLGPNGNETVLHSFDMNIDGCNPRSNLAEDAAGNLYGTTYYGGTSSSGMLFKLDRHGDLTVLYNFGASSVDGAAPQGELVRNRSGHLFGVTQFGGLNNCGAVFEVDPTGAETVLFSFNDPNGNQPRGGLLGDKMGNLYGTTFIGGRYERGVAFKVKGRVAESTLHTFASADGTNPASSLTIDAAGNLYGTTSNGGPFHSGVVFEITHR